MTPLHGDYGINIIKGDKNYGLQAAIMVKLAINQKPICNYICAINQKHLSQLYPLPGYSENSF